MKKLMTIKLHWKYAVKIGSQWVALNENGTYYLSSYKKNAETRWDIRGAQGIKERYISNVWNTSMGEAPVLNIVKIHRPQRLNLVW